MKHIAKIFLQYAMQSLSRHSVQTCHALPRLALLCFLAVIAPAQAVTQGPVEIHDEIMPQAAPNKKIALTLDACSGRFDGDLIRFLVYRRIPATIFATQKWLDENPVGQDIIESHLDLFEMEDHGEKHIPAVIGAGKKVYGIAGEPDLIHLRREVTAGAAAVEAATGIAPHWYRGATAEYDAAASAEIEKMGYQIAGFSVNADDGATAKKLTIEKRLAHIKAGDIIIAHMNKPASDTAEGLAVGLAHLLEQGFMFVRLDKIELEQIK